MVSNRIVCVAALGLAAGALAWPAAPAAAADAAIPDYVTAAVNDPGRPVWDIARDTDRKPAQAVAFSGIKPGDVVAEFAPGGGYYTRILSKVVGDKGRLYAVAPMPTGYPDFEARIMASKALVAQGKPPLRNPVEPVEAIADISEYANVHPLMEMLWQYGGQFSLPEQVDAVWTSDNYHDLHNKLMGVPDKVEAVDKAIFNALKPGGMFVVIDHAAAKGAGFTQTSTLHRADPDAVKQEVMAAGFALDAQSNALVNPADDHTKSALDKSIHDKWDEFALRFVKPLTAVSTTLRPPKGSMDGYYGNTSISNMGVEDKPPHQERRVFYHADGIYQEFGLDNSRGAALQEGLWYWDAAGHNCMIHQYPAAERGFVVCHLTATDKHVGDHWTQGSPGTGGPATTPVTIIAGYHPLPDPRAEEADPND